MVKVTHIHSGHLAKGSTKSKETQQNSCVWYTYNPSLEDVYARRTEIQVKSQPHSKIQASLDYMKLKTIKQ